MVETMAAVVIFLAVVALIYILIRNRKIKPEHEPGYFAPPERFSSSRGAWPTSGSVRREYSSGDTLTGTVIGGMSGGTEGAIIGGMIGGVTGGIIGGMIASSDGRTPEPSRFGGFEGGASGGAGAGGSWDAPAPCETSSPTHDSSSSSCDSGSSSFDSGSSGSDSSS